MRRPSLRLPLAALLVVAGIVVAASAQDAGVLDLRGLHDPAEANDRERSGAGTDEPFYATSASVITSHEQMLELPLKVTILEVDKRSVGLEEQINYSLRVENIGGEPYAIPWSPDWNLAAKAPDPTTAGIRVATVVPVLTIEQLGSFPLGGPQTFSAQGLPSSRKILQPGEWITLLCRSQVLLFPQRGFADSSETKPVFARLDVRFVIEDWPVTRPSIPRVSSNSFRVELQLPPLRTK